MKLWFGKLDDKLKLVGQLSLESSQLDLVVAVKVLALALDLQFVVAPARKAWVSAKWFPSR
jgi:hypothetical protein